MILNDIDNFIEKKIDEFYELLVKDNLFSKLKRNVNFVEYINEINLLIKNFVEKIDLKPIKEFSSNNQKIIINVLKKYLAFVIYLNIAYYYQDEKDLFITNIVETSQNQSKSTYQIEDFYTTQHNAKIIDSYVIIKDIIKLKRLRTIDKIKSALIFDPIKYQLTIDFINLLGEDIFMDYIINNNDDFNVIKAIIYQKFYQIEDKKDLYLIVQEKEDENAEYIYIDVVVRENQTNIDLELLEDLTDMGNRLYVEELYQFIEDYLKEDNIIYDKVEKLLHYKNIIPISEDFLKYHKNNYSYQSPSEKEESKIKYIVSKIKDVMSLNDEIDDKKKFKIKQYFPNSLKNRNAILYNEVEDIKILNKMEKVINKEETSREFVSDLNYYRRYNLLNFKKMAKDGIKFRPNKTINVIRQVNIDNLNDTNFNKDNIQYRIGNDNIDINVVGIVFGNKKLGNVKLLENVREKYKNPNGFEAFKKTINEKQDKLVYWNFNLDQDKIKLKEYQNVDKNQINIMLEKIYEELLENKIKQFLSKIKKFYPNIFNWLLKNNFKDDILTSDQISFIEKNYYYNLLKKIKIDLEEDLIDTKLKTLPTFKRIIEKIKKYVIGIKEKVISMEEEIFSATCLHHINWKNIQKMDKRREKEYSQAVFDFIKQYLKINDNGEYICQSCSELLPVKKFILESDYTAGSQFFITTNMAFNIDLENSKEYSKYIRSIRNIDRIIEAKLSQPVELNYYLGSTNTIKIRRKLLIKEIIDLLILHNQKLKPIINERKKEIEKYQINPKLSSLFAFTLTDDIFVFSTKEVDYFKILKYNNIIIYSLFVLISNLNKGQILEFKNDKRCNVLVYSQIKDALFGKMLIRFNNSNEVTFITKYPVLCYLLYYFSCMIVKTDGWIYTKSEEKGQELLIQKIIITTFIDLVNSFAEENNKEENYLYQITCGRFFNQLQTFFNDEEFYQKIKTRFERSIKITDGKLKIVKKVIPTFKLEDEISEDKIDPLSICYPKKEKIILKEIKVIPTRISNLTNCPDGNFHQWKIENKKVVCLLCNYHLDDLPKEKIDLKYKYRLQLLQKLANRLCLGGGEHNFVKDICQKCKIDNNQCLLDEKLLLQLEERVSDFNNKQIALEIKLNQDKYQLAKEKLENNAKFIINLENKFNQDNLKDYQKKFIDILEKLLSDRVKLINQNVFLKDTFYLIDHDYRGNPLPEPITIFEKENLIKFKKDEPHFKVNVYYYFNNKSNTTQYYDATTLSYLGYKRSGDNYNIPEKVVFMKRELSIEKKLSYLGFDAYNYPNINIREVLGSRLFLLKNIIGNISSLIIRIINNEKHSLDIIDGIKLENNNNLIDFYHNKIKDTTLENNKKFIFEDLEKINNLINLNYFTLPQFNNIVEIDELINVKTNIDLVLFYLINQFKKLIEINENKFTKTNLAILIVELINLQFNMAFTDYSDKELKIFKYLMDQEEDYDEEEFYNIGEYHEILTDEELKERNKTIERNLEMEVDFDVDEAMGAESED